MVSPYSPKRITGVGTFLIGMHQELKIHGHETIILAPPVVEAEVQIDAEYEELPYKGPRFYRGWRMARALRHWLREHRNEIDIVHLQTPIWLCLAAAKESRALGLPLIVTVHGKYPKLSNPLRQMLFQRTQQKTLALCDTIVFVDKDSYNFYGSQGMVISNGVDTIRFKRDPIQREKFRDKLGFNNEITFLFLGRWVHHKGIFEAIHAFSRLTKVREGVRLILVGHENEKEVYSRVKELELEDTVRILGRVDDTLKIYNIADIFLLPTSSLEGLPFSLVEAMSFSLTVIAGAASGIRDVISDGKNGILLTPRNQQEKLQQPIVEELFKKMIWCVDHKEECKLLGEEARQTSKMRYSLKEMVKVYIDIYDKCKQ
jgi:glycosyltransferase involved in cell wall biosynthesis